MSTSSATEAARQRNGRFGPQVRSELDPANAGLGAPEAPLPTWDAALAHAEVLRERGVDVQIGEKWKWKWIAIRGTDGELHDLADGTPAWQGFYPDGTTETIEHWTNGKFVSEERFPRCAEAVAVGPTETVILGGSAFSGDLK